MPILGVFDSDMQEGHTRYYVRYRYVNKGNTIIETRVCSTIKSCYHFCRYVWYEGYIVMGVHDSSDLPLYFDGRILTRYVDKLSERK